MIPGPGQSLSFLMAAPGISDEELDRLGIEIAARIGTGIRGLLIPDAALRAYKLLIREHLRPGFWNEIVGRGEIFFSFKSKDGVSREFILSPENRTEIAGLCTASSGDPIEKTSDLPRYLAANAFYRDLIAECHSARTVPNDAVE